MIPSISTCSCCDHCSVAWEQSCVSCRISYIVRKGRIGVNNKRQTVTNSRRRKQRIVLVLLEFMVRYYFKVNDLLRRLTLEFPFVLCALAVRRKATKPKRVSCYCLVHTCKLMNSSVRSFRPERLLINAWRCLQQRFENTNGSLKKEEDEFSLWASLGWVSRSNHCLWQLAFI